MKLTHKRPAMIEQDRGHCGRIYMVDAVSDLVADLDQQGVVVAPAPESRWHQNLRLDRMGQSSRQTVHPSGVRSQARPDAERPHLARSDHLPALLFPSRSRNAHKPDSKKSDLEFGCGAVSESSYCSFQSIETTHRKRTITFPGDPSGREASPKNPPRSALT